MHALLHFILMLQTFTPAPQYIEAQTFTSNGQCQALNGSQCVENFTWAVPFNDSGYTVTCTGENPHVVPLLVGIEQKTAQGFTIRISTYRDVTTGAGSSFEKYNCMARGNMPCTADDFEFCGLSMP